MKSQGKGMNRYIRDNQLLFALKKVMGTQRAAAKAVDCSEELFFYYLNSAKKVPMEITVRSKVLLLQYREKIPEISDKDLLIPDGMGSFLPISLRVIWGKSLEKQEKKQRGRPTEKKLLIRHNCDQLILKNERTDDWVAKKCGLKNRARYRRASQVVEKGCSELIQAMDKGTVTIYLAAKLARLSKLLQRELVGKDKAAMTAYFREQSEAAQKTLTSTHVIKGLNQIWSDKRLKQAEKESQLPLRKTFIGLLSVCNVQREFPWHLKTLQKNPLLAEVPLSACLAELSLIHGIEKKVSAKSKMGHLLF